MNIVRYFLALSTGIGLSYIITYNRYAAAITVAPNRQQVHQVQGPIQPESVDKTPLSETRCPEISTQVLRACEKATPNKSRCKELHSAASAACINDLRPGQRPESTTR